MNKMRGSVYLIVLVLIGAASCLPKSDGFVDLEGDGFYLNGEKFFPIMINYVADFRYIEDTFVLGVHRHYEKPEVYEYHDMETVNLQRGESLTLIKDMGFNTIRLCLDRIWGNPDSLGYPTDGRLLYLNHDNETIFSALEEFLKDAGERELKIMILIPPPVDNEGIRSFTVALLKRFSEKNVIFSYDFNNEPLYDRDHSAMEKKEVFEVVSEWEEWMDRYAPKQLLTIGYSEPIEVFSWDPAILPVDFLSFHTYNPLRVPNEIYWYANYSGKPWMIGETALRVDGEDIPYEWQGDYMKAAFDYTVASGGIGFGWWGFQEVPQVALSEESTGLMTSEGTLYTSDSLLPITGTFKPAVKVIQTLDPKAVEMDCERKVNYFNMLGYGNYYLTGKLVDDRGNPIEGGCIRGWNQYYAIGQNTFSDKNGNFKLYTNDGLHHILISAPGKERIRINKIIEYKVVNKGAMAEESLPNRDLEYQSIDYRDYLKFDSLSGNPVFFEYRDGLFDTYSYKSSIGEIELDDWD